MIAHRSATGPRHNQALDIFLASIAIYVYKYNGNRVAGINISTGGVMCAR